jgi:hypothetical protein
MPIHAAALRPLQPRAWCTPIPNVSFVLQPQNLDHDIQASEAHAVYLSPQGHHHLTHEPVLTVFIAPVSNSDKEIAVHEKLKKHPLVQAVTNIEKGRFAFEIAAYSGRRMFHLEEPQLNILVVANAAGVDAFIRPDKWAELQRTLSEYTQKSTATRHGTCSSSSPLYARTLASSARRRASPPCPCRRQLARRRLSQSLRTQRCRARSAS